MAVDFIEKKAVEFPVDNAVPMLYRTFSIYDLTSIIPHDAYYVYLLCNQGVSWFACRKTFYI